MKRKFRKPLAGERRAAAMAFALALTHSMAHAATGELTTNAASVSSDSKESNMANNVAGITDAEAVDLPIITNSAIVSSDNPDPSPPNNVDAVGIPDNPTDSDGDGIPDYKDLDDDNDGIPDTVEIATALNGGDTDGDGIPDYLDLDSDNDGIPDAIESGRKTGTVGPDGRLTGPVGTDGIPDSVQTDPNGGGINYTIKDSDGDGHPDFQDLDSDNDGINDVIEAGGTDANGDGKADGPPGPTGIPTSAGPSGIVPRDTDGDGVPDYRDLDSDNDGINDVIENGGSDPDGNGMVGIEKPADSDGDGIPDLVDGLVGFGDAPGAPIRDTDGDGIPDYRDLDSDNDSIPDVVEGGNGPKDTNHDGTVDITEGGGDPDGDGIPLTLDGDPTQFGDGTTPPPPDKDKDGIPDYLDPDSDNDDIPDIVENGHGPDDENHDGKVDDPKDTDGDGIPDVEDTNPGTFGGSPPPVPFVDPDTDGDGIHDYLDLDDDNDGIPDTVEDATALNGGDTDGDGIPDRLDLDSDNDGIPDSIESGQKTGTVGPDGRLTGPVGKDGIPDSVQPAGAPDDGAINYTVKDTDGDGRPDFQDLDSDNDGINDVIESGGTDTDGDGKADGPVGTTGFPGTVPAGGQTPRDSDGDGTPDFRDLDSDNDGINDVIENGGSDPDGDGIIGSGPPTDTDGDGIPDSVDGSPAFGDGVNPGPRDTDGDGIPDYRDLDSDNDGINDVIENGGPTADPDGDGIVGTGKPTDSDGDGIPDSVDGKNGFGDLGNLPPLDTDHDGVPDYRDLDSDNDGINDVVENGGPSADPDGDGIVGTGTPVDTDHDGIPDVVDGDKTHFGDGSGNPPPLDTDHDGVPNYRDLDSDNDGINDVVENGGPSADSDGDGIVGTGTPVDADHDGIADVVDGDPNHFGDGTGNPPPTDTDGDGVPNFEDLDSDNDTIPDVVEDEHGDKDLDGNGTISPDEGGGDTDGDGIPNVLDGDPTHFGDGLTNPPVEDTDKDGTPNFEDLDSDGDKIPDIFENGYGKKDTNDDGKIDDPTDKDGDGIPDVVDRQPDTFGGAPFPLNFDNPDTDGDGITNFFDQDDDNDGIPDIVEDANALNGGDTDGDGIPDYLDLDSDGDGIPDAIESGQTTGTVGPDGRLTGPVGTDGIPDSVQPAGDPNGGKVNYTLRDSDGDSHPDYLDLDSDNDGITDLVENGNPAAVDLDHDGKVDPVGKVKSDANGLPPGMSTVVPPVDTDHDGAPDYRDLDSDNDSISDLLESGNGALQDSDHDGLVDGSSQANGLPGASSTVPDPVDSDHDGKPDYRDTDSDGDGTNDIVDNGYSALDANGDGMIDNASDGDGDGISNTIDTKLTTFGGFPLEGCKVWNADPANATDTDGDVFPPEQEYAFGGSTSIGDHLVKGTSRREGLSTVKRADGDVDVSFVRPQGRYDVTYTLYGSTDLATWSAISTAPKVVPNGDGTDTVIWEKADLLAGVSRDRGFVRLSVSTPCHPAESYTLVQGWSRENIVGTIQTYGVNFTSMPVYTGMAASASGSLLTTNSDQSFSSLVSEPGATYYVEFTDGPGEGQRFDISGGVAGGFSLSLSSPNNTASALPSGLTGSHFVVRKHRTLGDVFAIPEYKAANSSGSADQIQFYNGHGFDIDFNLKLSHQWTGTALLDDQTNRIIPPGEAVYVTHPTAAGSNSQLQVGDVRYNDFVRPLVKGTTGLNFVAQGYPIDASPSSLSMTSTNGFTKANSAGSATQIQLWKADQQPNTLQFSLNFLYNQTFWLGTKDLNVVTDDLLFKHDRGAFIWVLKDNRTWTHSLPWSPSPWVQPQP